MRALLIVYLCVYYLLIAAATVTIWRAGLIDHLPRGWTYAAIGGAVALGVVLYEIVTGQRPFTRESTVETLNAILKDDPPEPTTIRADLPPAFDRIVRHCLEKNPAERFQTARDVIFALETLTGTSA